MSELTDYYNIDYVKDTFYSGEYCVVDVETHLIEKKRSTYKKIPHFLVGGVISPLEFSGVSNTHSVAALVDIIRNRNILVGHNIRFDLTVLSPYISSEVYHSICDETVVWDTQLFTYIHSGQTETWPSLDKSLIYFGLGHLCKEADVSEKIKSGVCPSTMDINELGNYLKQDVEITHALFVKQLRTFKTMSKPMCNVILQAMKYQMVTHRMSSNGLQLNREEARLERNNIYREHATVEARLYNYMLHNLPNRMKQTITPSSPRQVLTLLGGGEVTVVNEVKIGVYKTGPKKGTSKTKKIEKQVTVTAKVAVGTDLTTSEKDLSEWLTYACLASTFASEAEIEFITDLLDYRKMSKDLKTYFDGYLELGGDDGLLKPQYNHCVTPTGRISCSNPNLMNLPK